MSKQLATESLLVAVNRGLTVLFSADLRCFICNIISSTTARDEKRRNEEKRVRRGPLLNLHAAQLDSHL